MISANPRQVPPWVAWLTVVVILAGALTGVLVAALHYRQEAAMRHRQSRPARVLVSPDRVLLGVSSDTVPLPASGKLAGEVTVFAARFSTGQVQVIVTARLTGGRPDSPYVLAGGDCAGHAVDRAWAWGTTDSRGSAHFSGRAWTVSAGHEYYLMVGTPGLYREHPGPTVHGHFGLARGLSSAPLGTAPCAP